ncbi:MAG: D-alanine--D-alanine ligase [Polyangiaceae bacterium]|nr:D-alanine--D-alanine ligase [Polyangiaceae bacterium]
MSAGAPLEVIVIAGGPSVEAEVSRASAAAVARALEGAGHGVERLELDAELGRALAGRGAAVAFPVTHGALGEDGCLQGLLEVVGLPYVGSGVLAAALAASKPAAKRAFAAAGLPLAAGAVVQRGEDLVGAARRVRAELGPAVIVKPASGGSGIGVGRVGVDDADAALVAALDAALADDAAALVEALVFGDEVTCGVLEDDAGIPRALPPTLVRPLAADWYDFVSRYRPGGSEHVCPAPFEPGLLERIQRVAVAAHVALGARDLSRCDFVVDAARGVDGVTLLELNALPGMTATSLFPEAAAVAGVGFGELCDRLVRRAARRGPRPPQRPRPLP